VPENYTIVYSLNPVEGLDIVVPVPYICTIDPYGQPAYLTAVALPENTDSYIPGCMQTHHFDLIVTCSEMSLENLESTINKGKKKPEKLQTLFADVKVQKTVRNIIDRKLFKWLEQIKETKSYLCYNLQRKIKASDVLLHFIDGFATPDLIFTNTQTGVKYELKFQIGDQLFIPHKHQIQTITDLPGSLILDGKFVVILEI
jgi:hypothetical protein